MKKNIFVVDDDPMFATLLSDYLDDLGDYQVTTFGTGEDCLAQLADQPHAIILDYYLDGTVSGAQNGLEIMQQIHKTYPDLKVIMLSAQEHYGVALRTIASGATHYVIKDTASFDEIGRYLGDL